MFSCLPMGPLHPPPLAFFELTTVSGETVVTPLAFPEMAWLGSSAQAMARRMARAVQSEWLDEGRYLEAVQLADPPVFERREIEVEFPAGPDPLLQPARRSRHVAFLSTATAGTRCLACVPALGIVALAEAERLGEAVVEAIRLEHRRNGRQAEVRRQVAAAWFEQIELKQLPLELIFHSAEGLRRLQELRAEPLLDVVSDEMHVAARPASGLADVLDTLVGAAEGPFARSVLVVGAEGCGKTALIHQYVRERRRRGLAAPRETSAARLIQGLTRDGGWQHALAVLCHELAERDVVLYVGHLTELFEVGQYQGNAVSLGEALREPLARGRLMLLAEATASELARVELRSPGFAALFQTVPLPERSDDKQESIILEAVAALAAEHRVSVSRDAVAELVALQRRFSPYSGFPGKSIRFFEELILQARGQAATLGRDETLEAFCAETGMPRHMLDARLRLDFAAVDDFFRRRLFGQSAALDVVTGLLAATKTGLARTGKPIASLLLIGPTGVGKTETAKALAEFMFGDPRRMIRIDMSEYADPAAVLRLLGDLGGDEGVLIGAVRRQPFSVVLFDELEKADPSFFDLLLQVLGEGRLTGGNGLTANFCGCFVVMTSNLGAEVMQRAPLGLAARREDPRRHFEQAVQQAFRPELFNRIDHIVPFAALTASERAPIFARELELMRRREGLLERKLELDIADDVADRLAALPGDPRYGARDVQRVLRQRLLMPLAHALAPHAYVTPLAVHLQGGDAGSLTVRSEPLQRPVDTGPLLVADALADARRHWQRVTEGPLFVNLVNQVFRLDKERQRHEKKRRRSSHLPHWDATGDAARERELAAVQQTAQGLFAEILELEGQALLALVGASEAPPDLASWRRRFSEFKQRAFHAMRPSSARCSVGLYASPRLTPMLYEAWCELASLAGFELRSQVVRLVEDPKRGPGAREAASPADEAESGSAAPSSSVYRKLPWPQKERLQGTLVGYEIELTGPAVFDYFRHESGLWRIWEDDRKTDAWVSVHNLPLAEFKTPHNVHRQHFFDGQAVRRQLKQAVLLDPSADWRCEFPDPLAWKRVLDQQFDQLMDRMLLGEEEA
ncbi:AAA family ATPase [Aquabacterium sp. A7-Y]|uniref:AAA family ATPase n=1 Tax=Aquabacterium sp. A7-Y TaxID=1349605 RepID=UPI00223CC014|nr:AAA family ATPase [Aquabacterium sp. A7-Y]MCW7538707.1 AAA family ATPase [Aquabacterium sp. A7-Y]